jgi:hypothetical protein
MAMQHTRRTMVVHSRHLRYCNMVLSNTRHAPNYHSDVTHADVVCRAEDTGRLSDIIPRKLAKSAERPLEVPRDCSTR